jgi:transcriptional regulator with XRE-family HTH domain
LSGETQVGQKKFPEVGVRIRDARKKLKVTQLRLAAQLQLLRITIDSSSIAKIETNRRPVTDIEVVAIARILKIEVSWLFENSDKLFDKTANSNSKRTCVLYRLFRSDQYQNSIKTRQILMTATKHRYSK